MDLTNIKPCVECKWVAECGRNATIEQFVLNRICVFVYDGGDCFEEVDDG